MRIDSGATNTKIAGSYFGFDRSGAIVADLAAARYIWDEGISSTIGVDPVFSSQNGATNQRNVFSPNCAVATVHLNNAQSTVISGNWFGYDSSGVVSMAPIAASSGNAVLVQGTSSSILVGTNADGLSDSIESNWFGCLYTNLGLSISVLVDPFVGCTIAGNYFGWMNAGNPNAAVNALLPSWCQAGSYIQSSGNTLIGKFLVPTRSNL